MPDGPQDAPGLPPNVDPARHITKSFLCPTCGYDLRYATLAGRCSQCGQVYNARTPGAIGLAKLKVSPVRPDPPLPEGVSPDRHITRALYCDRCGYSLRYSTMAGRCSECGNPYNTRRILMEGVFSPTSVRVPVWEMVVGAIVLPLGYRLVHTGVSLMDAWRLALGGVALALGLCCGASALRAMRRWIRFRPVLRRIRDPDDDA